MSNRPTDTILFIAEGVGAVFVVVFLAAYLGGLPTTAVLHSEPAFKLLLSVFGAILLILAIALTVLSIATKVNND